MQATLWLVREANDPTYVGVAKQFNLVVERVTPGDNDDEVVVSGKKSCLTAFIKHVGWGPKQGYRWSVDRTKNELIEQTTLG